MPEDLQNGFDADSDAWLSDAQAELRESATRNASEARVDWRHIFVSRHAMPEDLQNGFDADSDAWLRMTRKPEIKKARVAARYSALAARRVVMCDTTQIGPPSGRSRMTSWSGIDLKMHRSSSDGQPGRLDEHHHAEFDRCFYDRRPACGGVARCVDGVRLRRTRVYVARQRRAERRDDVLVLQNTRPTSAKIPRRGTRTATNPRTAPGVEWSPRCSVEGADKSF